MKYRLAHAEIASACEIQQPKYLCTLKGGRMQSFGYWWEKPYLSDKPWRPIPDSDGRLSSGIKDLDGMMMGGLEPGSVVLIELGSGVPISVAGAIENSLVSNFASLNRGVVWVPLRKASGENARARVTTNLPKETFDKCVRVGEHVSGMAGSPTSCSRDRMPHRTSWQTLAYHLQGPTCHHSLMASTPESVYGNQVMEQLIDHMAMVRRNKSVFVGIVSPFGIDPAPDRPGHCQIEGGAHPRHGGALRREPTPNWNAMQMKETEMGGGIRLTPIV
jgi:hypothetical protein